MSSWSALSVASAGGGASGAAAVWGVLKYLGDAAARPLALPIGPLPFDLSAESEQTCEELGHISIAFWLVLGYVAGVATGPIIELAILVKKAWRKFLSWAAAQLEEEAALHVSRRISGSRPYNLIGPLNLND